LRRLACAARPLLDDASDPLNRRAPNVYRAPIIRRSHVPSRRSATLLNTTLPEYMQARIKELDRRKGFHEIVEELGYQRARPILRFEAGEVPVPVDKICNSREP
jgi:hypothetical protein